MSPISTVLLLVVAMLFTSDSLKFASGPHRSADGQINQQRSDEHQINPAPSSDDLKTIQKRSASDDLTICSPNPCGPASICLICDVHNCPNQTAKNHLCLCWRRQMWKNCDDPALETTNSSGTVRENSCNYAIPCQHGSCVPKSVYPGYECQCDEYHTGRNCDRNKYWDMGVYIFVGVLVGLPVIFILIMWCRERKKKQNENGRQLQSTTVEKSQKTSAPPPPTEPESLAAASQTETSPSSSAKVTSKGSEPSVTVEAKAGESPV